ncbi:MAG: hypothetical protein NHB15_02840 [Methanosarcina barkeri]|nr:hypothetical protein [Methanosarcina sp. ERenArc_MAG2]
MSILPKQITDKILAKQTMDLSVPKPKATPQLSMPINQGTEYRDDFHTWSLLVSGEGLMQFNLSIAKPIFVTLTLRLCAALVDGCANCPITITANGNSVESHYRDTNEHWHDKVFQLDKKWMKAGNNEISISLDEDAKTQLFIKAVTVLGEE